MLVQASHIINADIVSLHTGKPIGLIENIIINPHQLDVLGFYCSTQRNVDSPLVLLTRDVRQVLPKKVLINSSDELVPGSELIRMQDVLKINFQLLNKPVYTESKQKLGKVEDYAINSDAFLIQKLYVKRPIIKSMGVNKLVIDRVQILEVSDKSITVQDTLLGKPSIATA